MYIATDRPLTLEEQAILRLTARYGMTVVEAAARALKRESSADAQRLIDCLVRRRLLTERWLYAGRRYYRAANQAIELVNDAGTTSECDDRPLSEESKIRRFAMLSFCCLGKTPRTFLSITELSRMYPGLDTVSRSASYYREESPSQVCGFLRVDMGGHGRWDRILAKSADDARRLASLPAYREPIADRRFEITIATALPQKAERLLRALEDQQSLLAIRIAVIPDLLNIIAPPPH